jgi:hypothetical protein
MKTAKWVMLVLGCSAVLLAALLAGCILPGKHGGPPGLPPLPGLPGPHRVELPHPAGVSAVAIAGEDLDPNESPQIVQNGNPANPITAAGEFYE